MVLGSAGSEELDTAWYLVKLGQYKAFMPVYIEKVKIWSDVTIAGRTDKKER